MHQRNRDYSKHSSYQESASAGWRVGGAAAPAPRQAGEATFQRCVQAFYTLRVRLSPHNIHYVDTAATVCGGGCLSVAAART